MMVFLIPAITQIMPDQKYCANSEILIQLSTNWDQESSKTFALFIQEFFDNIKYKKYSKLINQIDYPFYIFLKNKQIKINNKHNAIIFFKKNTLNSFWFKYTKNPDDLALSSHGVMWGRGELWFNATIVNNNVVWKLIKIAPIDY